MLYLVQYDLNNKKDYASLIDEIKRSPGYARLLLSTWGVVTDETAEQLATRLHTKMDSDDHLLVVEWTRNAGHFGWLSKQSWDWIKEVTQYQRAA